MKKGFLEIKTDDSAEMILVKIALLKLEHRIETLEEINDKTTIVPKM